MLPAIAATAITRYTQPGDLVADPMCGIGTTLIEAIHLGRDAIGVEYEPRWASWPPPGSPTPAATAPRHRGGDLRRRPPAPRLPPPASPGGPRWWSPHRRTGPASTARSAPSRRAAGWTSSTTATAATPPTSPTTAWTGCSTGSPRSSPAATLLRPGGIAVITARPWRHHGELVDLPSAVIAAGPSAGLTPIERCVALLAGLRGRQPDRPARRSSSSTTSAKPAPAASPGTSSSTRTS